MSCAVNVSGTWKYAKQAYVNVGGSWKPCQNIYVNVSGAWKPLYTYSYATGNWGACSANCGGGTQTRTVTCQRRDATNSNLDVQTVADSFCVAHGLTKPATSRECNTQECVECKFSTTDLNSSGTCVGNVAPSATDGWLELPDFASTYLSIYWGGNIITLESYVGDAITSKIVDGYLYSRSTHQGTCTVSSLIPPSTIFTVTHEFYTVCRQAV